MTNRSGLLWGALAGAILTPALLAILYLGEALAGLPFLPFDFFDWLARTLPGPVLTAGIDAMVGVIRGLNLGPTDQIAKLAEQALSLIMVWALGALLGALAFALFARLNTARGRQSVVLGLGAALTAALLLIHSAVSLSTSDPLLRILWIALAAFGLPYGLHSLFMALRPQVPSPASASAELIDRRTFLIRLGGASALFTVIGAGLPGVLSSVFSSGAGGDAAPSLAPAIPGEQIVDGAGNALPNADDPLVPAPGTRREYTAIEDHYRIDISLRPPEIAEEGYTLPISGLVANPVEWTLDEIRALPALSAFITMSCISNPIGGDLISTTKWTGVPMQRILEIIQPDENAQALLIRGADGFDEYLALDLIRQDERIMLAYAWDDAPLPTRNGFPLRIHIPDRYGMKQPKWITSMEVVDTLGEGYWVRRGWSREALVRATSVIDTVATGDLYTQGGQTYVPVGGIAWAGARGIRAVYVRVNGGEWQAAQLRRPLSERSWVIWRYDWPFSEGTQRFEVRCEEEDGTPQIEAVEGVRPDGATGIHSRSASVEALDPEGA